MKELSIEQKAQRYDEAIEALRSLFSKQAIKHCDRVNIKDITNIFHELRESEGERTWIINYLSNRILNSTIIAEKENLKKAIAWLEKQGEQKPTDKVEPKFKAGDFIVNDYCMGRIVEITKDAYLLDTEQGILFSCPNTRLWDITKDAKDGDVLYLQHDGKEHIIIYKGVIKEKFRTIVSAYCAYNGIVDAFCFADVSRYTDIAYGGIMPATKEQRDLLFQKMHEAGYEWDAEKKELKKVEFNPDDIIEESYESKRSTREYLYSC